MFKIGKRTIGDSNPCFITLEAGPTIDGFDTAINLIEIASKSKADAIKFQLLDADQLIADKSQLFEYEIIKDEKTKKTQKVTERLFDILKRRELSDDEWRELKRYCDVKNIEFFATILSDHYLELLESLGADTVKIASTDINHIPLIVNAAKTGMSIQLDTGNATYEEIKIAIKKIEEQQNRRIIIHHCPTGYPAHLDNVQLSEISKLKSMFPYPIAFSDHTPGWHMNIGAICMGANMVEKTITLDKTTPSVEHMFSLEEWEVVSFIKEVREVETAIKDTERKLNPDISKRFALRRSIFLKDDVKQGSEITPDVIEFRKPGHGLTPDKFDDICFKIASKDLHSGNMLQMDDFL